VSIKLKFE